MWFQGWDEILMITLISEKKLRNDSYCATVRTHSASSGTQFKRIIVLKDIDEKR